MSESKIGKWLTRNSRTAVVFAERDGQLFGVIMLIASDRWAPTNWKSSGASYIDVEAGSDLVRRVSDSTDLTPYVPTKRVRPWTRAEVEAIVQQRPLWVKLELSAIQVSEISDFGFRVCGVWYSWQHAAEDIKQLDGSPCGVEVEE